jgi:ribonuclease P protein component
MPLPAQGSVLVDAGVSPLADADLDIDVVTPLPPVLAGFSASTRKFPHAVDRNRVKRLTRECWRLQKKEFYPFLTANSLRLAVFFIYTDKKIAPFATLHHKISVILKKLEAELTPPGQRIAG